MCSKPHAMESSMRLEDCTIVWLCPLEVELRAAIAMLDKVSDYIPERVRGQNVVYTVGEIGRHKVAVVGYYQEQGLGASGSMAAEVLRDLPNLQMGLLVGIAGGMPSPTRDIQLGDIVVAVPEGDRPGVVGYDLGKMGDDDKFELKHWQNATHPLLRSIITIMRAHNESKFMRHLGILENRPEFQRPGQPLMVGDTNAKGKHGPKVHYGTILSGNSVIKSKIKRDMLRDKYHAIAVEMEAAGMMTRLPVAVIRGISDFADSSKNDEWQPYAAIAAAAYAKEILTRLPFEKVDHHSETSSPFSGQDARLAQALPERWAFVGRGEELRFLEGELGFQSQQPLQRHTVGLWGLTGVGKSQLASRFVSEQRSKYPEREIFWISGGSQEAFEQSVMNMLSIGSTPASPEDVLTSRMSPERRMGLVNSFFAELNRLEDARWLLVIDEINGRPSPAQEDCSSFNVHAFVDKIKRGYVLLISRRRDTIERYYPYREVRGLNDEDTVRLFQMQIDERLLEKEAVEKLANLLKGMPLALRLAISVISRYRYSVAEYLQQWKDGGVEEVGLLAAEGTLSRSMELSFQELESTDPILLKLLTLFSFLDSRDMWYELSFNACEDTYPSWLRELVNQRAPFRKYYPVLADLSFIELRQLSKGRQIWETHPAIQMAARRRAAADEGEYIRCAVSLVAAQVPRSNDEDFWDNVLRLEPHADQCWTYIERGKLGPVTNLTDLEDLGRLYRHLGRNERALLIYRMIENGLKRPQLTAPEIRFLADVSTNLGLVNTSLRRFEQALLNFQRSWDLQSELNSLTPDASMSLVYNRAVVYTMMGRLDEAEKDLRSAAAFFRQRAIGQQGPLRDQQRRLHIRILNDLGEVLLRKNSLSEAKQLLYTIVDSKRKLFGDAHPTVVSIKLNLGRTHTKLREFSAARSLLEEVIAMYTEWWGRRHPDTMRAVDELAFTLFEENKDQQGRKETTSAALENAEKLWNEVLGFYETAYGDESDMAQRIKLNLGHLSHAKQVNISHMRLYGEHNQTIC